MPTIIDSLFLELGIDVSKFSADQQKALAKIAEFEKQTKRASGSARDGVKTVGKAFKDLAGDSAMGGSAKGIDSLAVKLKALGQSAQVAGGAGGALGGMATGLGRLLSPASLGIAALGLLGKATWDFNADMTATNATLARNAELSGMSADKLWALGEAAKTVGGNPAAVEAGIAGLQTALAGQAIGVGSAQPQMIGVARLSPYGARYNPGGFGAGVDEESLFKAVYAFYQQNGRAKTMAMVTGYSLGTKDQADLMMSPTGYAEYKKAQDLAAKMKTGGGFDAVVHNSLKSQTALGEKDIAQAISAEQAYGGIQAPMQTLVGMVTGIFGILNTSLGWLVKLVNFFTGGSGPPPLVATTDAIGRGADAGAALLQRKFPKLFPPPPSQEIQQREVYAANVLMKGGESPDNTKAMLGNIRGESNFDPFATTDNGAHLGLFQLDRRRQAAYAKQFGYQMGSNDVPWLKQFFDQVQFSLIELKTTQRRAQLAMDAAPGLEGKTRAFMDLFERPGSADNSFLKRFNFAQDAYSAVEPISSAMNMLNASTSSSSIVNNNITNTTRIDNLAVTTPTSDPRAHAEAVRSAIQAHPLLNLQQIALMARGTVN